MKLTKNDDELQPKVQKTVVNSTFMPHCEWSLILLPIM